MRWGSPSAKESQASGAAHAMCIQAESAAFMSPSVKASWPGAAKAISHKGREAQTDSCAAPGLARHSQVPAFRELQGPAMEHKLGRPRLPLRSPDTPELDENFFLILPSSLSTRARSSSFPVQARISEMKFCDRPQESGA